MESFLQGVRFRQETLGKAHSRRFTLGSLQGATGPVSHVSPTPTPGGSLRFHFGDILPDHKLRVRQGLLCF